MSIFVIFYIYVKTLFLVYKLADRYDLVVIGGGPGGYPAAIRASQLNLRTLLVEERDRLGGECTLYGCIPTKAMLRFSKYFWEVKRNIFFRGREYLDLDYTGFMSRVEEIVSKISSGIDYLLKNYGVEVLRGRAEIIDKETVSINNGEKIIKTSNIIIATGSEPSYPPNIVVDKEVIHDNRSILSLRRMPSNIIIIGGGYIGVEFATIFSRIGSQVYIVEMMPNLLPGMDVDVSRMIEIFLRERGVKIFKNTIVKEIKKVGEGVEAMLSNGSKVSGDIALVATGRRPNTRNIGLERVGVYIDEKGFIKTDSHMRTNINNIYASGDVAGQPMLAHKAFIQAVVAAENVAGLNSVYEKSSIPQVVFSDPDIVQVGMTVDEAKKRGFNAVSTRIFGGGVARSVVEECENCFIKIVYDKDSERVLGIIIMAPEASELAGEASLIIENGLSIKDLSKAVHPHPTISEFFKEIVDYIERRSTHYLIKR